MKSDSPLFLNVYCHAAVLAKMDADALILDPMVDQVGPPPDVELKGERRRRTSKQPPDKRLAEKEDKKDEANDESGDTNGGITGADQPEEEVEKKVEIVENLTGQDLAVLDPKIIDVDAEAVGMKDRKRKRGAGKKDEKVKKIDDEKAEAKKKRKPTSKVRTRSRGETKMLGKACDVDSGEEGYDDEEEEAPKEEKPKEALADKAGEDEGKGGAKIKAKCKAKVAKDEKKPVRDQCKSKKFHESLPKLPESLRNHFHSLSRYEQTQFIHDTVSRDRGRLSIDQSTMMRLMTKREELQAGREKMKGYALEDLKLDKHDDPNINKTQHFQIRFSQLVATAENILLLIFPSSSQTTKP